jgi:two-component system, NtrC family, response regulator HydG
MLVGISAGIERVRDDIRRLAGTNFTVLITGESGTGKELVARHLHNTGPRRRGPFVAVNCAAIVDTLLEAELFGIEERTATGVKGRRGKFELAEGGTLFLDEVGDLSLAGQAKLLRALQDLSVERVGGAQARTIDTRLVAATNRDLTKAVESGRFRADLYYRLAGVEVWVPPLRDRREDVPLLIDHILGRHHRLRRLATTDGAVEALCAYDWPGNIRQLERVLERVVALAPSSRIELSDLPADIGAPYGAVVTTHHPNEHSLRAWSSRYARLVLNRCDGNKRRACAELGISYHTLQALLAFRAGAVTGDARALTLAGSALNGGAPTGH